MKLDDEELNGTSVSPKCMLSISAYCLITFIAMPWVGSLVVARVASTCALHRRFHDGCEFLESLAPISPERRHLCIHDQMVTSLPSSLQQSCLQATFFDIARDNHDTKRIRSVILGERMCVRSSNERLVPSKRQTATNRTVRGNMVQISPGSDPDSPSAGGLSLLFTRDCRKHSDVFVAVWYTRHSCICIRWRSFGMYRSKRRPCSSCASVEGSVEIVPWT